MTEADDPKQGAGIPAGPPESPTPWGSALDSPAESTMPGAPVGPTGVPAGPADFETTALDPHPDRAAPRFVPAPPPTTTDPAGGAGIVIHNEISTPEPRSAGAAVLTAFVCFVLGLILTAGGGYLVARFGFFNAESTTVPNAIYTIVGGVLLLGAVLLNGFSAWASAIPGLVLAVFGAWMIVDPGFATQVQANTSAAFPNGEMVLWGRTGWMFALGLVMVAASLAAALARAAGRRSAAR